MGVLGKSISSGLATGLEAFWGTRENQRILHVEAVRLEIVGLDSEKRVCFWPILPRWA